jgi:hypothetical protein
MMRINCFYIFILSVLVSCSIKVDVSTADKILYRFNDSSLPDEYHRSYNVVVTPDSVLLEIDSYGNILLSKSWAFNKQKFDEVKQRFNNLKKSGNIDEGDIADGGTSESITFYVADKVLFKGIYHSSNNKNFSGIDEISLTDLIPDFTKLLYSTRSDVIDPEAKE